MPNKYFSIDGIATYLHHTGATTRPEVLPELDRGHVVVCLHDAGGNGRVFDALLAELQDEHSPLAFDLPAHGRSAGLDALGSIEKMCEHTRALLDRLHVSRSVLVGHGMGGSISLELALREPSRCAGLVLVSSAAEWEFPDGRAEQTRLISEGKARRSFDRGLYAKEASPETLRRGFTEDTRTDPRATYGDLIACQGWTARERLGGVSVPSLVVEGAEAHDSLRKAAEVLRSSIPGASGATIDGAAHMIPLEQPKLLASSIRDFLREVTP